MKTTINRDELTKNDVKKILGLKKWSIRAERLLKLIEESHNGIINVYIKKSSDYNWASRTHIKGNDIRNATNFKKIGADSLGNSKSCYYIYAAVL